MSSSFNEIDEKTLKKLRKVQLEILDEIDRICKKNKIKYFLEGGTLLGAIRHKGFIPWDDDLDISMLREDYNKFIKVCAKDLSPKFYLDCIETNPNFHLPFAKVKKNNTILLEKAAKNLNNHNGIWVDISPVDIESSNFKKCYIKAFVIKNLIETVFYKKGIYQIKDCNHPILIRIIRLIPTNKIFKIMNFIATSYKDKKGGGSHIIYYYGAYSIKKEYFNYDDVFPTKDVIFEGKKYPAPKDVDKFLTSLYGDYMKLPPKDKRVNHNIVKIAFDENK